MSDAFANIVSALNAVGSWPHLTVLPIVLPLASGAVLLLVERWRARWVTPLALASVLALLLVAVALLVRADSGVVHAYLLGNWAAPYGITLALDRLAALLLVLTALVGVAGLLYASGGDAARGAHFHSLFQWQLMGLNGAFLTADLFNLFVFFEVLLAASYALMLHGEGPGRRARLTRSLQAIVFNLAGSALFLVAVSLLYGVTGTLNMADLALKFAQLPPQDLRLAQAAALMLLVVFAVKAALLPLYFWLPDAYAAATAPVAALFAVMTKVGVYAIARTTTLIFGAELVQPLLPALALATLVLAAIGVLAARRLKLLVAYAVVGSAGTLLLAVGLGTPGTLAAAVVYLVHSTLVVALLFLWIDRFAARRGGSDSTDALPLAGPLAALGAAFFVGAAGLAGLPPLAGFVAKSLLLQAAGPGPMGAWIVTLVLGSSFAVMVGLARAGSQVLWKARGSSDRAGSAGAAALAGSASAVVRGTHPQRWACLLLLGGVIGCGIAAGPLAAYAQATAAQLGDRQAYLRAVLQAEPAPPAFDVRRLMRERGAVK